MRTSARLLGGRYRLGALLGEGAMSTVSVATDELLQREVAIKMLKPAYAADEQFVARFYAEARTAASIMHPHVISIYDILSDKQSHAIVMEYAQGPSLAELLAKRGSIEEDEAIAYARQAAQALAAAHGQGVLHRDIKPGNLLLTADGELKVADFGLAKAAQATDLTMTQPGQVVGTAAYFSPEQVQGQPLSPASDLYSMGIVIYQLVTGRVPFTTGSPISAAVAHVMEPAPNAHELRFSMRPALAEIVARLLQKDPRNRFASADDLDASLGEIGADPVRRGFPLEAPTISVQKGTIDQRLSSLPPIALRLPEVPWLPRLRVAAIVLLLLLAALALPRLFQPRTTVPNVRHESLATAQARLRDAGLAARVATRPDERIPSGQVISVDPRAGSVLRRGAPVVLTVSTGLPVVTLPNLIGTTLAAASQTMRHLKLRATYAARISDAPANTVVQEIPGPGTRLREYSPALVVISAGPQPQIFYSDSAGGGD